MLSAKSYATHGPTEKLVPWTFERRDPRPHDVVIEILYCGVCHSDLHQARDEWGGSLYPMVPGHEIVGKVTQVGVEVKNFKPGDLAGVGVLIDSCRKCKPCLAGEENYCVEGMTGTYNALERDGKTLAQGGYSNQIVTDENYVLHISPKLDLKAVAPLLCAGITTYSPLRYVGVKAGMKVAVVGLGGLGHMGLKFAVSFGAEVSLVTTSKHKEQDARRLGASQVILSTEATMMKKFDSYFDVVLNTLSANHSYSQYLRLLGLNGTMINVGLPTAAGEVQPFALLKNRRSMLGSGVGGIKETQEMLDYCADKNIVSDVELIPIHQINEAYERMLRSDVRYRFVIDMATLSRN